MPSTESTAPKDPRPSTAARRLLLSRTNGVLSTISQKLTGYPIGSVVPFCLDGNGLPVILISALAEHTRDLNADPRASLTVTEAAEGNVQTRGRLTLVGDFARVVGDDERTEQRYYRYFPGSRDYREKLDFDFYRMDVKKTRYIGGFGAIHWFEPDEILAPNPFTAEQESSMVNHMNEDHVEALRTYCRQADIPVPANTKPLMTGVDAVGFDLLVGETVHRLAFDAPVDTPAKVRQALVALARKDD